MKYLLVGLLFVLSVYGFSEEKKVEQFLVVSEIVKKEMKPVTLSRYISGGKEILFISGNGVGSVIEVNAGLAKSIKKYEKLLKNLKEAQGEKLALTESLGNDRIVGSYVIFGDSSKKVYMKDSYVSYLFSNEGKNKGTPAFAIMTGEMKGRDNKFVVQKARTIFMYEKDVVALKNLKITNLDEKGAKK